MLIVSLPARAAVHQAVAAFQVGNALHPNSDAVFLTFADVPAMDVLAYLGAWGLMARGESTTIKLRGEPKTLAALQLLGFHQLLDILPSSSSANHQPTKAHTIGVLPLSPIATEEQQYKAVDAICTIALAAIDNATAFIPALEWLANEILGNILTHAASETPGVVCAQYRPKQQRFDIGICDRGRGILGSLQPAFPEVRSYGQAIDKAIERGATRDPAIGQGNGMAGGGCRLRAQQGQAPPRFPVHAARLRHGGDVLARHQQTRRPRQHLDRLRLRGGIAVPQQPNRVRQ
jgi:hypothetical protein